MLIYSFTLISVCKGTIYNILYILKQFEYFISMFENQSPTMDLNRQMNPIYLYLYLEIFPALSVFVFKNGFR